MTPVALSPKPTSTGKLKILIANGVNLDLLGQRQPEVYGTTTLAELEQSLVTQSQALGHAAGRQDFELHFFQTNLEGDFLNELGKGWDGALLNPGAWTHYSLALADRLVALSLPFVEVHLSQLSQREAFRQQSVTAKHALGVIYGFGLDSYAAGLFCLLRRL